MTDDAATAQPADPAHLHVQDLIEFVQASPSSFHAAEEVARRLTDAGATRVDERDPFPTEPGSYVLVREGAAVAWHLPADAPADAGDRAFRITGSHTDSPGFRLKPNPQSESAGYVRAEVEVYGGALVNAWLDREIEFAGIVATHDGRTHLTRTGPIARVPQLAIHLHREINSEGLKLHRQEHTHPVLGLGGDVREVLAAAAGVDEADVAAWDLISFDTQPPRVFGMAGEFLACGRLDNLLSVHASLVAFEDAMARWAAEGDAALGGDIPVLIAFDHEEVGSASPTGAAGPLLADMLDRIAASAGADGEARHRMLRRSVCVSADGAHAVHPNYSGEHDPGHRPTLNVGPVIKVNANQRYATDAWGQAFVAGLAERAGVPVQTFVSANHKPCGSTIGPITATRLGIRTIDVGAPMLSMHSPREMTGARDPWLLAEVLAEFWR
ncbi:M18 family aminopeptidase [Corynebacterium sp. 335C]